MLWSSDVDHAKGAIRRARREDQLPKEEAWIESGFVCSKFALILRGISKRHRKLHLERCYWARLALTAGPCRNPCCTDFFFAAREYVRLFLLDSIVKRGTLLFLIAATLPACTTKYIDPAPRAAVLPAAVAASYDRTWEATVGWFAEQNIPIQTIEKASGIIVADVNIRYLPNRTPVLDKKGKVDRMAQSAPVYADCGHPDIPNAYHFDPSSMIYNIRVLGDASKSTVQVNARYATEGYPGMPYVALCASTGKWETDIQQYIKSHAEAAR